MTSDIPAAGADFRTADQDDRGGTAVAAMGNVPRCSWCDRRFRPRQSGGRPPRFCRTSCRRAFYAAARAWALNAIAADALSLADIRSGLPATRTLITRAEATLPMVTCGPIIIRLDIPPDALADLRRLGWLPAADRSAHDAVAYAVGRSLRLRLSPRE